MLLAAPHCSTCARPPPAMTLPASAPSDPAASTPSATARRLAVQLVFLGTGVFSTCAAQYAFYEGAGDQRAMLLPLCNYLGMMLSGLVPLGAAAAASSSCNSSTSSSGSDKKLREQAGDEPECAGRDVEAEERAADWKPDGSELTRRQTSEALHVAGDEHQEDEQQGKEHPETKATTLASRVAGLWRAQSAVQACVVVSVVLDFAGCIFSNLGLSMAGSGLFQVVYSSVICWSALLSRLVLKKVVSREQWLGIALVTFGLAFSALGESAGGRNNTIVLMGCFNTLVGAAFYGGNYVTGEYTLKLPERPQPRELCLKIGAACVAIVAAYQVVFVLPDWHALVTQPIADAGGNTTGIFVALVAYTLSQLAHGMTYFMLLGSSGAVTTGIMQSLRAVCVFAISSLLYCGQQESQCFDTKRGVATLIVVSGVLFYSWAKAQGVKPQVAALAAKTKMVAGKNYVV